MLHILEYNGSILDNLKSYCPVVAQRSKVFSLSSASVETSASEQQNSPAIYNAYKSNNIYNTTTQS